MVVAYLRGILKPELQYGLRSALAENLIFEALDCENLKDKLQNYEALALATIPALTNEGVTMVMRQSSLRQARLLQLTNFDLYCIEEQLSATIPTEKRTLDISPIQMYRLLEKNNMFEKLDAYNASKKYTPIL